MIAQRLAHVGAAILALALVDGRALAGQANTLDDLQAAIGGCVRVRSPSPAWAGSEITVRFSLHRDGNLLGPPRITYSKLPAAEPERKRFVAAALSGLTGCFPLAITMGLGSAIAGRPWIARIVNDGPSEIILPLNRR